MSPRLSSLPDGFGATVASLHRVAEEVVAPARKPDNEIALEATPGRVRHSGVRVGGIYATRSGSRGPSWSAKSTAPQQRTPLRDRPGRGAGPWRDWYALRRRRSSNGSRRRRAGRGGAAPADPLARALRRRDRARLRGRRAAARPTASRPATSSTPSPTPTSGPGRRRPPASSGTRTASAAPSSATPSCLAPRTRRRRRSSSSPPVETHLRRTKPTEETK